MWSTFGRFGPGNWWIIYFFFLFMKHVSLICSDYVFDLNMYRHSLSYSAFAVFPCVRWCSKWWRWSDGGGEVIVVPDSDWYHCYDAPLMHSPCLLMLLLLLCYATVAAAVPLRSVLNLWMNLCIVLYILPTMDYWTLYAFLFLCVITGPG